MNQKDELWVKEQIHLSIQLGVESHKAYDHPFYLLDCPFCHRETIAINWFDALPPMIASTTGIFTFRPLAKQKKCLICGKKFKEIIDKWEEVKIEENDC